MTSNLRRGALALALLALCGTAAAAPAKSPGKALIWSLLPGGGHFYLGEVGTGIAYAASTAVFLGAGAEVQRRNDELGREDEYNAPSIVGEKIWELSFFTAYRDALAWDGTDIRALGYDDTPTADLILAPFSYRNFLDPWVLGAGVLGGVLAVASAEDNARGLGDVSRVGIWGRDYNRRDGTAAYGASALMVSLGAGVAEEALFRGLLQTMFQNDWGKTPGLWAAAGTFGAAHIVGPDGKPNIGAVLATTAGGAYFGWLYNREGNRLAKPIAAHFWYDFMLMAASWAADPENNALGVEVSFQM